MKVYHSFVEISMLVAFLCIGHVLTNRWRIFDSYFKKKDAKPEKGVTPQDLDMLLDTHQTYAFRNSFSDNITRLILPELPETTIGDDGFFCRLKPVHDVPSIWRDHKVPYYLRTFGFSEEEVRKVKAGIASWNEQVPEIQFVPWKGNDTDFVFVMYSFTSCSSSVGRQGGPQILLLGSDCSAEHAIHHEMMHTVGFSHEHSRRDRDKYVEVLYDNIPVAYRRQYDKIDGAIPNLLGPYEYLSTMHYSVYAPGGRGKVPSFNVLKEGVDKERMGKTDLTKIDKMKIKRLYE